jgi:hypothetical protein
MRRAAAVDANQVVIVEALRDLGASVHHLHQLGGGTPDLLVGWRSRTFLLEVKDGSKPPSRQRLTPDEESWIHTWNGRPVVVVHTVEEAFRAIGAVVKGAAHG